MSVTVAFKYNNREYTVPAGLTMTAALERTGYFFTRGVGCRAGFCGACAVVYRLPDDPEMRPALACQMVMQDGMDIARVAYLPAHKAVHDLDVDPLSSPAELYPQINACIDCDACTKACPTDLKVMDFVHDLAENDLSGTSEKSFGCVMCQLCANACPVNIAPANVALYARRVEAKFHTPPANALYQRVVAIENGDYDAELDLLASLDPDALRNMYHQRTIDVE